MRNIPVNTVDHLPRRVLALGTDYPPDTQLEKHSHRRAQFLYAMNGLMKVETEDGHWLVPPYCGVWIPATRIHRVWMPGVSTYSLYIEPGDAPRITEHCEVLHVSPLLHQLLLSAGQLPLLYDEGGRDAALIALLLHELHQAAPLPLFTPLPRSPLLAGLCAEFIATPCIHSSPECWARRMNKSVRTFNRWFARETGLSFREWRNRACLQYALTSLREGMAITDIALNLGYEYPAAFTNRFRKATGISPATFVKQMNNTSPNTVPYYHFHSRR
ncbi:AraC family transcriptional regulator [Citrobacter koseri]|uniref:AraC family transcriptional regulator n=1 Tax=Citrobacter koseri TaxID=545 RepID=UPI003891D5D4